MRTDVHTRELSATILNLRTGGPQPSKTPTKHRIRRSPAFHRFPSGPVTQTPDVCTTGLFSGAPDDLSDRCRSMIHFKAKTVPCFFNIYATPLSVSSTLRKYHLSKTF